MTGISVVRGVICEDRVEDKNYWIPSTLGVTCVPFSFRRPTLRLHYRPRAVGVTWSSTFGVLFLPFRYSVFLGPRDHYYLDGNVGTGGLSAVVPPHPSGSLQGRKCLKDHRP